MEHNQNGLHTSYGMTNNDIRWSELSESDKKQILNRYKTAIDENDSQVVSLYEEHYGHHNLNSNILDESRKHVFKQLFENWRDLIKEYNDNTYTIFTKNEFDNMLSIIGVENFNWPEESTGVKIYLNPTSGFLKYNFNIDFIYNTK